MRTKQRALPRQHKQQKALFLQDKQGPFAVGSLDVPTPGPGELLLKVESAALNPVDWKIQTFGLYVAHYPAVIGADAAGTVAALGEDVSGFSVGDRVFTQGTFADNARAAYQQYLLASADITAKIPDNVSLDGAASLPVCVATAVMGLFNRDDLDNSAALYPPWEKGGRGKYTGKPIVVFGGATSVGQYVIQFVKLAGFSPIITTASLHNTTLLKSLGATHVLNRRLPPSALISAITDITRAPFEVIYDAVALEDTQNTAYDLLAPGGTLVIVLEDCVDPNKKTGDKEIMFVFSDNREPRNRRTAASLYNQLTALLRKGLIKPNRVEVLPNGLAGIPDGLERLKHGEVSGLKLIARPQETA